MCPYHFAICIARSISVVYYAHIHTFTCDAVFFFVFPDNKLQLIFLYSGAPLMWIPWDLVKCPV